MNQNLVVLQAHDLYQLVSDAVANAIEKTKIHKVEEPPRKLLNINQAAELTGIKKNTLYLYTSQGKIPYSKRANKLFFFEDELIKWIEQGKHITNH